MTTTTWAAIRSQHTQLARKALEGSAFLAATSATAITALTTGSGASLQTLPAGYSDLGVLSTDGTQFGRDVSSIDVTGWGYTDPIRSDVSKDTDTIKVLCKETNVHTLGLYTGAAESSIVALATTKETIIDKPALPPSRFYRLLVLARDDSDGGDVYIGRFFPRVRVSDFGSQSWQNSADGLQYEVTLTSFVDSTIGYSARWLVGGPGWQSLQTAMGIADAS